jgi:hypothetical protein
MKNTFKLFGAMRGIAIIALAATRIDVGNIKNENI